MPENTLFSRFGVELEYMIVDAKTLDVRPVADTLMQRVTGDAHAEDVSRGRMEWSNELALHVIEIKTGRPSTKLDGLDRQFQGEVDFIQRDLADHGLMLLPTAMHPWMNPMRETRLWPHGNQEIYGAFHRIFNCRGHGWGNLQSVHLNLPFADEAEFFRLHTAIRLLLPILPALTASSPFAEGRSQGALDYRLQVYQSNCHRIPSVTGDVIPEPIRSFKGYHQRILNRIYRDLSPEDPEGILRHEWANARGAITRFERNTIEIRVLDIQECPAADLAVLQCITNVLRSLTEQETTERERQLRVPTRELKEIFETVVLDADQAVIDNKRYLRRLGFEREGKMRACEIWAGLMDRLISKRTSWRPHIELILNEGCLGRRILEATGKRPTRARLQAVYRSLADCLKEGTRFHGEV